MEAQGRRTKSDKIWEKVSPVFAFVLVLFPIVVSFININIAVYYITLVYIYFFYKSAATAIQFAIGLSRIRTAEQINWVELLEGLRNIPEEVEKLKVAKQEIKKYSWDDYEGDSNIVYKKLKNKNSLLFSTSKLPVFLQRFIFGLQKRKTINFIDMEIGALKSLSKRENLLSPDDLQHIVMIPHVKEPVPILRETLECLKNQSFNTKQLNIVLAAEAADPNGVAVSEQLKEEYKEYFNNIWITNHVLQPYDVIGKSANMDWAGKIVYEEIKKLGWDLKKTTVTSADADSKLDPNYFAYVTYKYITTKNAEYKYYASAMVFYNNIWRLPFYARVKNSFHSVTDIANLVRSDKLVPFSTYTTSFWVLEQIDFWDPWITPEDYHLFFKGVFTLDKNVSTVPIYLKTLSDAAEGEGHWSTITNNYKQSRRWAWGISDGGWMIKNLVTNFFSMSWLAKYKTAHVIFDHMIGLSIAFLILLGGIIPGLINPDFSNRTTGILFGIITSTMVQFTLIFMFMIIILDFFLRPNPENNSKVKKFLGIFEWVVQPFAALFLTAIPGLEAQTRLVFGRYLEYYVTKKKAADEDSTSS